MHVLPGRTYTFPVPPSDTPVCVAGEAEPVLVAALSTQALQQGSAVASPRENLARQEEYRRACVAHIPAAFANDWAGAEDRCG